MLGLVLLYVGIVLINNGICRLTNVSDRATSVMNVFTGILSFVVNILAVIQGSYYAAATGLLFGFTYLFVAANGIFGLDRRPFGWYSLFVAINSIPCAWISLYQDGIRMSIIWLLWGVLWATGFIELVMKKDLGKFVPYLSVFEGIVTAWIPGFLLLINKW